MWRLLLITIVVAAFIFYMILRPRRILKVLASAIYFPGSPLSRRTIPIWASYFLNREIFEGPPVSLLRLEEEIRTVGYFLLAIPLGMGILVIWVGS